MIGDKNMTNTSRHKNLWLVLVMLVLLLLAGTLGWWQGKSKNTSNESTSGTTANGTDVNSIVSYTLPDGWKEANCTNQASTVFIVPTGSVLQCDMDSIAPIKISVDPQNTTDCQELSNVQDVRKHICKSLFIGGHKTIQASTEYPKSSSYPVDTTISDYYINTNKGVIRIQYTYTSSNDYQLGFDQLANSVRTKT